MEGTVTDLTYIVSTYKEHLTGYTKKQSVKRKSIREH